MDFDLLINLLLDIDATNAFNGFWSLLVSLWNWFFNLLNSIKIGGVSLLFINIALTVFGLIFTVFFAVVKSGVSTTMDVGSSFNDDYRLQKKKEKNDTYEKYAEERRRKENYDTRYKSEKQGYRKR